MKKKHFEARFAGVGGQGVILAGKILAYGMVNYEEYHAIQTPTYTAQVRGGATKVDVVLDENNIEYPKTEKLDFFLSLHQKSFDLYFKEIRKNAIIVVDPNLTPNIPEDIPQEVLKVELVEIAKEKMGKALYAAVIAIGVFAKLTGIISEKNILKAVIENAPPGTEDANLKAVKIGIDIATTLKAEDENKPERHPKKK